MPRGLRTEPHLPWAVPSRYYDMAPASAAIPLAVHTAPPTGMPALAFWSCSESELAGYSNVNINTSSPLDDDLARSWRRGYYASVRYTDDLIGRVLAGLQQAGKTEETVVVLHGTIAICRAVRLANPKSITIAGDHGWQLGEHGIWCKQTCECSNGRLVTAAAISDRDRCCEQASSSPPACRS